MENTSIMTDVALERLLEQAEDNKAKQDIGKQLALEALRAADHTGARVSGASLADEYRGIEPGSVRWWQDRLRDAREEYAKETQASTWRADTEQSLPTTSGSADLRAESAAESASPSVPIGTIGTQEPGIGTQVGTELADLGVPASWIGIPPATEPVVGTASATPGLNPQNTLRTRVEGDGHGVSRFDQGGNGRGAASEEVLGVPVDLGDPQGTEGLTGSAEIGASAPADRTESVPIGTVLADQYGEPVPTLPKNAPTGPVPAESASTPVAGVPPVPVIGTGLAESASSADVVVPIGTGRSEVEPSALPTSVSPAVQLVDEHEIARAEKLQYAFYGVAVVFALVGQVWAGVEKLPFPDSLSVWLRIGIVLPAMAVIELAGVATSHQADLRRRMGEQAYGYRTMSLLAAAVAAGFNLAGHWGEWFPAIGFTGLSVFAYVSWLLQSNARRRDALRAMGKLAVTPPVYGVWQWVRRPGLTRRARTLAVVRGYDVHESVRVAREEARTEARDQAIAAAIERRIRDLHEGDDIGATIAATTYDLGRLADEVKKRLDYATAADFIATDLVLEVRSEQEAGR